MTISRSDLAAYLDDQFSIMAQAIGQNTVIETGYRPDIDNALRRLGKSESELATATVADGDRNGAFVLAEYYAARRFFFQFGSFVNRKTDDSQFDYKQAQLNVKTMMDEAARQVAALGYEIVPVGTSAITPDSVSVDVVAVW